MVLRRPAVDCVLDARAAVGEGALWSERDAALWWVDIPRCQLHCFDVSTGQDCVWTMPSPIGCLALREQGGLVIALANGWHAFDPATGALEHWLDPEPEKPGNRFNDGATDPAGRFWAGTMPMAGAGASPEGALYRLDPDRGSSRIIPQLWIPNGLAFSADGRTMYLSDTHASIRTIWAFDYDLTDGVPGEPRVFFDTRTILGRPDGAAIDTDGCYWFAAVGGWEIVRLTPSGNIDRRIPVPVERPTKLAFGGSRRDMIYVTSMSLGINAESSVRQPQAGGLFAVSAGVQGMPTVSFAG